MVTFLMSGMVLSGGRTAIIALLVFLVAMIVVSATGLLPLLVSALIAAGGMLASGCLTAHEARSPGHHRQARSRRVGLELASRQR
jgi:hypothetical protein